uniref:BRI3-binding protein n=1 Tax=Magnetococcus massalia (strain MO-1) TaxID=451514 RepID=A0A1S7LLA9_MAGMO
MGGRRSGGGSRGWLKWLLLLLLLLGGTAVGMQSCSSEQVAPTERYERLAIPGGQ